MHQKAKEIKYFFFSQYFSDGLRITLGVLLPSLLLAQFGLLRMGLAVSLGAFGASLTDAPGPVRHRRNAILACAIFACLVAQITEFARGNPFSMGAVILLFSLFFSMLSVYGNRAASVGLASLLVMVLSMNPQLGPGQPFLSAILILGGCLWYLLLSLAFNKMLPYLGAQQALGECIHEVAHFLRLKAAFFQTSTSLEEDYRKVVSQQIVVSEKQDAVRELLFKSRQIVKESTSTSRTLVLIFGDLVDLYEQMMKIHYDYASLRERFGHTGILEIINQMILEMAEELDAIGFAIQSSTRLPKAPDLRSKQEQIKKMAEGAASGEVQGSNLAIDKILKNVHNLSRRLTDIRNTYTAQSAGRQSLRERLHYSRFVSHQDFSPKILRDNLSLRSSVFRHAIRMAVACLFGFIITRFFTNGGHSYWVILTILVILKPGFSLTRQRNYHRLAGTLIGGFFGVLIVIFVEDSRLLFALLLFFMIGAYSFLRTNYILMVACITPMVLILFKYLGAGDLHIVYERVVDTLAGCGIAFAVNYLIFPNWEAQQIQKLLTGMIKANSAYLQKLAEGISGKNPDPEEYKLARKAVYVNSANLSAAFQRMTSEPKNRQKNTKAVHQFVVLNHILSSYIATVVSAAEAGEKNLTSQKNELIIRKALQALQGALQKIEPEPGQSDSETATEVAGVKETGKTEESDQLLTEQLEYIRKVCEDISKVTEAILSAPAGQEPGGKLKTTV